MYRLHRGIKQRKPGEGMDQWYINPCEDTNTAPGWPLLLPIELNWTTLPSPLFLWCSFLTRQKQRNPTHYYLFFFLYKSKIQIRIWLPPPGCWERKQARKEGRKKGRKKGRKQGGKKGRKEERKKEKKKVPEIGERHRREGRAREREGRGVVEVCTYVHTCWFTDFLGELYSDCHLKFRKSNSRNTAVSVHKIPNTKYQYPSWI